MIRLRRLLFTLLLAGFSSVLLACHSQNAPAPRDGRYPLSGEVISVDRSNQQVTMKHGDIPGLMKAMTMTYPLKDDSVLRRLSPGDHLQADLVVQNGVAHLESVVIQNK
jgi:protein SCO1/2